MSTVSWRSRSRAALLWTLGLTACTSAVGVAPSQGDGADRSDAWRRQAVAVSDRPAVYVDGRGLRWELSRSVTELADPDSRPSAGPPTASERAWDQLSDEEAIELLRPITLTPDNYEYALDDESTLELVRQVRGAASHVPAEAPELRLDAGEPAGVTKRVLSEDRFPTQTFGGDGRVNMNGSAGESPWSYIASMDHAGQCTAFKLINNHTAVTAAHCVHDGTDWKRRKTLQFAAGAESPRAVLPADCYSLTVANGWKGSDVDFDYAIIRLREDGVDAGAWCDEDAYAVGHFGYQVVDDCVVDIQLNLAGYPSTRDPDHPVPPGNWAYPALFTDYRDDGWTACLGVYPKSLWFYNDGSNGQSGAPVWTYSEQSGQNKVRAIYRGSLTSIVGDSNHGRRIDPSLISWLRANAGY